MMPTKIAFRENGNGPILILMHGFAGSVLHWDPFQEELGQCFRVVVPNLSHLYMGKEYLSFTQQVDRFKQWIDLHFSGQPVHLCGISYGAALAWGVGIKYPEMIGKVVLINPIPPRPFHFFRSKFLRFLLGFGFGKRFLFAILATRFGQNFIKKVVSIFRLERADLWGHTGKVGGRKLQFVAHILHHFSYLLRNEKWNQWTEKLEGWAHPSLMIVDPEDPLFVEGVYRKFQKQIHCDAVYEIHGAGHMAIQTRSEKICHQIKEFLNVKGRSTAA